MPLHLNFLQLKSTEFLNLDAILEGVMHKLVVRPLREHLYKLFVDEYVRNGAIQLLYENLNYARTKSLRELGLKVSFHKIFCQVGFSIFSNPSCF